MSRQSDEARLRQAAEAGDMDAATELAGMLVEDGDLSGAEQWNRRAAEADNHDGIVDLGVVLMRQGRFEEAEPWLRKGATDPRHEEAPGFCEAVLGHCLFMLGRFDEAEQWLATGAAANIDIAVADLEKLRKARAEGNLESIRHGSPKQVMQTFDVDSVMFYDGVGHRLGQSVCTLTRESFIIDDARGESTRFGCGTSPEWALRPGKWCVLPPRASRTTSIAEARTRGTTLRTGYPWGYAMPSSTITGCYLVRRRCVI